MDNRVTYIKEEILKNHKSLREFSKKINMPYTTLKTILSREFGKTSFEHVEKICAGLNMSLDELSSMTISERFQAIIRDTRSLQSNLYEEFGVADLSDEERKLLLESMNYTSNMMKYLSTKIKD